MRSRDEVLREFGTAECMVAECKNTQCLRERAMADRIRELEAVDVDLSDKPHPSAAAVCVDVDALSERVMSELSSLAEYAPASAITPPRWQVFYGVRFSDIRNALRAALTAASEVQP